jgi:hypothetical protein
MGIVFSIPSNLEGARVAKICAFCSGEYGDDNDPDFCSVDCSQEFYRAASEAFLGYVTLIKEAPEEVPDARCSHNGQS